MDGHHHHHSNCTADLQAEQMSTTDVFLRSYSKDLEWLDFSVPSIGESMQCKPGVIRSILVVVPEDDVPAFEDKINSVWTQQGLPSALRSRWKVLPSTTHVLGSGYQEQMLDKMHADLYSDAEHFVFLDTDTVLVRDLQRDQLFDDRGRPRMCFRSVAKCGSSCEMWMQEHVKRMIGDGEMLDHEYMCLGQAYPRFLFAHLRYTVAETKGNDWRHFVKTAREEGGATQWVEADGAGGFTEFNAMGAVLWRDFHDEAQWMDLDAGNMNLMAHPLQTWSWEENKGKRESAKKVFDCLRKYMHDEGVFDHNLRIAKCTKHSQLNGQGS
eukprot:CAMPEP_0194512910 /NCGR_PEP_ID=MMETSP0253-20130528/45059_1 /TAXON_ID=2966 /ORGANISM="Noctiluca scintillans" /LENGTH=324 /DNA_ID=CAMNT_0039356419 /DNA_START=124 /DNA_END=1098 /DNA_ORIENTATION=-